VQPAIDFNTYRFFTGTEKTYKQAPRIYSWDWRPAKIEFYSDSAEGESFTYSTQRSLKKGEPDFTQCLPADMDVRINLWNLYGSLPPTELAMKDSYVVEVVIDGFSYTPSGVESVPDGGACSKDCHCDPASVCLSNVCTTAVSLYDSLYSLKNAGSYRTNNSSSGSRPMQTIVGFTVFGLAVVALIVLAAWRMRKKKPTAPVNLTRNQFGIKS
jgi:hypothetical protein